MATKKIIEVDVVNSLSDSDAIFVNSDNSLKQIPKSNLVTKGDKGETGETGGYYTPSVDDEGNLSWTASKADMPAVDGTNIKGPQGTKGDKGNTGATGKAGADGKSAYQYAQEGGYTGTEEAFSAKLAQEQLTGTTNELTPTQVYEAVSAGIPVKVQYFDGNFGIFWYTNFNVAENMNAIASNTIVYYNSVYILGELVGNTNTNEWFFLSTILAQKTDIPSVLPNPNALTFTGAVTGTYDGSAPMSVNVPNAVTDAHINELINTALGVIENGSY